MRLTEEEDTEILRFFEHDYIDQWTDGRHIRALPADAIHLACALRGNSFWTTHSTIILGSREPRVIGQMKLDLENDSDQNA